MSKFRVGDRAVLKPGDRVIIRDNSSRSGEAGVIASWSGPHENWAVELEDKTKGGHSCDGAIPSGCGWFVSSSNLEKLDPESPLEQSVRDYIRREQCGNPVAGEASTAPRAGGRDGAGR